jgi:hypothetical protein
MQAFFRDRNSKGRRLFETFIREFIGRYKDRHTILFYELGNELNLLADVDLQKAKCPTSECVWRNFSSDELTQFAAAIVGVIKSLDPTRGVSSGYSLPREAAAHLATRPQYSRSGADWSLDTEHDFSSILRKIHQPFDIVSIHVYPPDAHRGPLSGRFDPLRVAAEAARADKKKIFVGEFGDKGGATPFMKDTVQSIQKEHIDYSALWVWEYYQTSTFQTHNTPPTLYSVEPAYRAGVIDLLDLFDKGSASVRSSKTGASSTRVVLTWPLPCASITKPINLEAVASDGRKPVERVEFLVDGKLMHVTSAPPYSALLDPQKMSPHLATIAARAISPDGGIGEFDSPVRLAGSNDKCDAAAIKQR